MRREAGGATPNTVEGADSQNENDTAMPPKPRRMFSIKRLLTKQRVAIHSRSAVDVTTGETSSIHNMDTSSIISGGTAATSVSRVPPSSLASCDTSVEKPTRIHFWRRRETRKDYIHTNQQIYWTAEAGNPRH